MKTSHPVPRGTRLRLGSVLRSPHSEQRGFSGFRVQSVPVGLNRSPDVRETGRLESRLTRARLASAGFENVSIRVSSAGLEVFGTSVSELDGELLEVLASAVDAVNGAVADVQEPRDLQESAA